MPALSLSSEDESALLRIVCEQLPDAVYLIEPDSSRIVFCNAAAHLDLGMARDEVLGHSVLSLQKDVVGPDQWRQIAAVIREGDCYVFVGRHRHKAGHEVSVEVHTRPIKVGGREYFLSVARDISARRSREHELLSREAQLRFALNEATDGLWDWDIEADALYFSPQLKRMLGYGPHEMAAPRLSDWSDNIHPDDARRVMQTLTDHIAGLRERYDCEYRLRNRNGHFLWVRDRGRVCARSEDGRPIRIAGMVHNTTEHKQLEVELQRLASHDSLTGLLNRRESEVIVPTQLRLCRRLGLGMGLAMIDVDHFKRINDVHGHLAGDEVLRGVATLIAGSIRNADHLFRWGGEEFLLVCMDVAQDQMLALASKLRQGLAEAAWPGVEGLGKVDASIGVACFPDFGDAGELLLAADRALYRAKTLGRGRVELATREAGRV